MEEKTNACQTSCGHRKHALLTLAILVVGAVSIVSILRERIVDASGDKVSVTGQGKISSQPDVANVTLGVQVDKAATAEAALSQLNDKMNKIIAAVEAVGIKKDDISTQNYSLNPQYDFKEGTSTVSGYGANQQVKIKVKDIQNGQDTLSKVVAAAGAAGSNQVQGIEFSVADMEGLKQKAKILAIQDAKQKSTELAAAAGVRLGKVVSWQENSVQSPEGPRPFAGLGAADSASLKSAPQIPEGTQDIIVNVSLTYEVK